MAGGLGEVARVEGEGSEPVGGGGGSIAVREAVHHLAVVGLGHLEVVHLQIALAEPEHGHGHIGAGGVGLKILAEGLRGERVLSALVNHGGVVKKVSVGAFSPRGRGGRRSHRDGLWDGPLPLLDGNGARHLLAARAVTGERGENGKNAEHVGAACHLNSAGLPHLACGWRRRCSRCRPSGRCPAR